MGQFQEAKLTRIPQKQNTAADQLARSASIDESNSKMEIIKQSRYKQSRSALST